MTLEENEENIKKKLNIDSWRNLSKDKVLTLLAEMPHKEKEVALKMMEQFPNVKMLVGETMSSFGQHFESAQKVNWKSQKKVHEASRSYRESLNNELQREGLSNAERKELLEMIRESVKIDSDKDSENKVFTAKLVTVAATFGMAAVGAAVAALGGKAGFGNSGRL